ncbi:hypothetical protein SacsacDRAFT_0157 [Saccharibacillus sacchari DSM 19268]|uniref:Uncharacterized protein n=1 Tax=Saccharibacillus sacchari DSM 19268 TaxID=915437 RepID=A0A011A112_9BACL|nr:hypothetical protein SacsacDRAFT_0157 [Saccharibacillus sacchari DSM 19268]
MISNIAENRAKRVTSTRLDKETVGLEDGRKTWQ